MEDEEEYDADPPQLTIGKGSSLHSMNREMHPRDSFKEILAKNSDIDNHILRQNPSLFRYNSQEDFLNDNWFIISTLL